MTREYRDLYWFDMATEISEAAGRRIESRDKRSICFCRAAMKLLPPEHPDQGKLKEWAEGGGWVHLPAMVLIENGVSHEQVQALIMMVFS